MYYQNFQQSHNYKTVYCKFYAKGKTFIEIRPMQAGPKLHLRPSKKIKTKSTQTRPLLTTPNHALHPLYHSFHLSPNIMPGTMNRRSTSKIISKTPAPNWSRRKWSKFNQKARKKKDLESKRGPPMKRTKTMLKMRKTCPNPPPKTNFSISNDVHRLIFFAFRSLRPQSRASRE